MVDIYVKVDFKHKDIVKKNGCFWNPKFKMWCVPLKINKERFETLLKCHKERKIRFVYLFNKRDVIEDWEKPIWEPLLSTEVRKLITVYENKTVTVGSPTKINMADQCDFID